MFSDLANLMEQGNFSEFSLVIKNLGGELVVVMQTQAAHGKADVKEVRQALLSGLVLSGSPRQLDDDFMLHMGRYVNDYMPLALRANTDELVQEASDNATVQNQVTNDDIEFADDDDAVSTPSANGGDPFSLDDDEANDDLDPFKGI